MTNNYLSSTVLAAVMIYAFGTGAAQAENFSDKGRAFREQVLARTKADSSPNLDLSELCRSIFLGRSVAELDQIMHGAGASHPLTFKNYSIPTGAPPQPFVSSGFVISDTLMSRISFGLLAKTSEPSSKFGQVIDVSCGVKSRHL